MYDDEKILDTVFWNESGAELKWVLPSLSMLLERNKISIEKGIEKITLVSGPGSFTGIRIAVSVVNTIKYLYSSIILAELSTGELFSALDEGKHAAYFFQVFASDVFEFDRCGVFLGRKNADALEENVMSQSAGMLMDTIKEHYPDFMTLGDSTTWQLQDILRIEKKAHMLEDLAEPFYGKGANITVPKKNT